MSEEPEVLPPLSKPRRAFRPAAKSPQISPEAAAREGAILRIAITALGSKAAQTFLNTPNNQLDGRPLSVATNDAGGFEAVASAIRDLGRA